nr:DUF397 domain-containing protein [Streptomyces sp. NBC_00857]
MRQTPPGITSAPWRRSSHSGANGNCVEMAAVSDDSVLIRDSKQPGPQARFRARGAWERFIVGVKFGELGAR